MSEGRTKNILILMAMQTEADRIIKALNLVNRSQTFSETLPFKCYQLHKLNQTISLVTSGKDQDHQVDYIGSEAATLMAHESIRLLAPDVLINAGTAGGFCKRNASIGSIYASDKYFVYHDRMVLLPGFQDSAIGRYPALNIRRLANDLNMVSGVISTGSSLEKNPKDEKILDRENVVAKDMEAAAIAWVAKLHKVPMFAIKSITNLVDEENQSEKEFLKNFNFSVGRLSDKLIEIITYLDNKTIGDLALD